MKIKKENNRGYETVIITAMGGEDIKAPVGYVFGWSIQKGRTVEYTFIKKEDKNEKVCHKKMA